MATFLNHNSNTSEIAGTCAANLPRSSRCNRNRTDRGTIIDVSRFNWAGVAGVAGGVSGKFGTDPGHVCAIHFRQFEWRCANSNDRTPCAAVPYRPRRFVTIAFLTERMGQVSTQARRRFYAPPFNNVRVTAKIRCPSSKKSNNWKTRKEFHSTSFSCFVELDV